MKINELKDRTPVDEITLDVVSKEEPRTVRDGQLRVCNAVGKDETGQVKLSLWNEDIEKVNQGDKIKITKGWASEYQGEIQLSAGKMGTIEVLSSGNTFESNENKEENKEEKTEDISVTEEDVI